MRIAPLVALALGLVLVDATPAAAQQEFVLTRNSVLHSGPSAKDSRVASVPAGEIVTEVNGGVSAGWIRVEDQEEDVGWVSRHNVRQIDPTEVHQAGAAAPSGSETIQGALAVDSGAFDGCAADGDPSPNGSKYAEIRALNELKNRSAEPSDADIDSTVTIDRLVAPSSDDSQRWNSARAAEIVAYVYRIIPGGKAETTNCRKGDPAHRDSHIELVRAPDDTAENRRVIVEVTPRWRAAAAGRSIDWSTATLQQTVQGHWVRVRGWLLFDEEHRAQAENTHPGNGSNWRATAWEIHPVTNLTILQGP